MPFMVVIKDSADQAYGVAHYLCSDSSGANLMSWLETLPSTFPRLRSLPVNRRVVDTFSFKQELIQALDRWNAPGHVPGVEMAAYRLVDAIGAGRRDGVLEIGGVE